MVREGGEERRGGTCFLVEVERGLERDEGGVVRMVVGFGFKGVALQ